ncbi:hypothetical protein ACFW16_30005 [Inquilinus sp. NPDC058860]|uniref:hypothetical protein n=1 Tax=Inquilinus sp. NPDC058860 TaxID=3346652 RepID=UPI00368CA710
MAVPDSVKLRGPSRLALQVMLNLYHGFLPSAHLSHRPYRAIASRTQKELIGRGFCMGDGEGLVLTELGRKIVEDVLFRSSAPSGKVRNGIPLLPVVHNDTPVTPELIKRLQNDLSV